MTIMLILLIILLIITNTTNTTNDNDHNTTANHIFSFSFAYHFVLFRGEGDGG